jgi:hypothetical protein
MARRCLAALVPWTAAVVAAVALEACNTSAVGIGECRDIESARCAAARGCADGIDSDKTQAECERFARDNCLHGMPIANAPAQSEVNACIAELQAAGACASAHGATTLAGACNLKGTLKSGVTACAVVENPEYSSECAFLNPEVTQTKPPVDAGKD